MAMSNADGRTVGGRLQLAKYSIGVGDRFAHQAQAQLRACVLAGQQGLEVVPIWNKSYREHTIVVPILEV